ncbi:hypothetical protein VTL71DRAFT_276 [Oculimacula yallundae]|uniref:Uncharacterized protein n=1 Tax=Oculimacula yallundae TaxID=86028 RepID=A0ABR4CZI6_9HELO
MSSSVGSSTVVDIDRSGDMLIKACEYDGAILKSTALFKVSSQVLIQNSNTFKGHVTMFGTANMDLHYVCIDALEVWLHIFHHGDMPKDKWANLGIDDIIDAVKMSIKYKFKMSRLNVWFAFWLGNQNLSNAAAATLQQLRELCQTLEHKVGGECIALLIDPSINPLVPVAFALYPPVPDTTLLQSSYELQLFGIVSPEDYKTWGFSPRFKAVFGTPTAAYSDFYRLVTTPFDPKTLPKYKTFEALLTQQSTFLNFCKTVDGIAASKNLSPVSRRAMEGAWACLALELYDASSSEEAVSFKLRKVFDMRFNPRQKVEEYWAEKGAQFGWDTKAIERLDDNCEEPDHEIAEPDEDDEMADAGKLSAQESVADLDVALEDLEIDN